MKSSRVFVKNLPPSISEAEFRKHFSAQGRDVTDVKLIPHRRIGFVGYKSPEDAEKAVKYFNKSFIRMSKIAVDFATPNAPGRDAAKNTQITNPTKPRAAEAEPSEDDASSKKRKRDPADESDPKLQEYLEAMGHVPKRAKDLDGLSVMQSEMTTTAVPAVMIEAGESDDEYEDIPARPSKQSTQQAAPVPPPAQVQAAAITAPAAAIDLPVLQLPEESASEALQAPVDATDDDWLRSRTNRLLDLVDPDDPAFSGRPSAPVPVPASVPASDPHQQPQAAVAVAVDVAEKMDLDETPAKVGGPEDAVKMIEKTSRLFLRNLSYTVTEDNVREHFSKFGTLDEVNVPLDKRGQSKGFAMVRYEQPESALAAFQTDGTTFQGRIVHILPAAVKRENTLDEFAISKLPLKKQQLLKKKAEAASTSFNWNSLFMSQDAVNTTVAERLGVSKRELLDPTDASAAVKQAVAETTVIQEAKAYFATHGVNIDAFKSQQRGDTSILVKNIKNATIEELRTLFEEHGSVLRVVMPPSGTIAIVQFAQPAHCRAAFTRKAYSRFKDSVLFLEKGPKGLFKDSVAAPSGDRPAGVLKPSVADLLERGDEDDQPETASLFVRNLNFSTTTEGLATAFQPLDGFASAQVKTRTDAKRPGQVLSMGFGFVAFKTKEQAQAAQQVMDGRVLDGHKLVVKTSHKGLDAAEERRREDLAKKAAAQRTKIVIKNLPFEASKNDVRTLFSTYGKLVSLRIPKKFNHTSRGFAFAEFSTAKEALNAITALKDTHLLGRRLVLDFAEAEEVDPEEQIKAMEKKVRGQVNKVAIQKLTAGRAKVCRQLPHLPSLRLISQCRVGSILFSCLRSRLLSLETRETPYASVCHEMELPVRLPVLPSQCYSSTRDYGLESHHGVSTSRQPLRESTGNAQNSQMAWYAERMRQIGAVNGLTPMSPSIPTPPIVPTQSLVSEYGSSAYSIPPQRHHSVHSHGRTRPYGDNPLMPLLTQAFQNYRKKQADKSEQKWPDVLEEAFVDALILIPQMKRKKYTMKQTQYGRNMLIGEYLWIAYRQSLPPGVEPDPQMFRERKQVSSHIQVLKKFIETNRCFHFLFGARSDDKDNDNDNVETISLKNNPILIALSEGRLPEERPNYEHYAKILALNDQVTVRPKRCWIFVSNQDVAVREDGSGLVTTTSDRLDENEYPHLARNLERESWAKEEQQIFKGALLHEFTKEMQQTEANSVAYLSKKWEVSFPELHRRLKSICNTTSDSRCTILHMNVTLEVKDKRGFPSNSELNSWVEMNIEQPVLLNHRWKVYTRLVRPKELIYSQRDSNSEGLYETTAEIAIQYQHRPGCEGPRHCMSQRCRRDWVTVPFPADVWAETLTNCAEYPAHPFVADSKIHDREREQKRADGDDEEVSKSGRRTRQPPTQMDLVPKIAMMQEIWSCSPEAAHEQIPYDQGDSNSRGRWARRALVTAQSGMTKWRFLTILDPLGDYHQQQAIVSGRRGSADEYTVDGPGTLGSNDTRSVSRDLVMSPSPTYQQHMNASMSETFSTSWDATPDGLGSLSSSAAAAQAAYSAHLLAQSHQQSSQSHVSAYDPLGSFSSHGGLATPPPSATLNTSFAHNFDGSSTQPGDHLGLSTYNISAITSTGMDDSQQHTLSSLAAVTDPFLTSAASSFDVISGGGGTSPYDQTAAAAHHHWAASNSADVSWSSTTPTYSTAQNGGAWGGRLERNHSLGSLAASEKQQQQHHHHHHSHVVAPHPYPHPPPPPPPPPQSWIITSNNGAAGTSGGDDSDLWTPATSTHTPITSALPSSLLSDDATAAAISQEWVHVIGNNGTTAHDDEDQEPSQEWADAVAAAAVAAAVEGGGNLHHGHHRHHYHHHYHQHVENGGSENIIAAKRNNLKRSRSDSFDDEGEDGDEYGAYNSRRHKVNRAS
ncbi:hypothetical protein QBC44DRAFT_339050 [Cladorrhinum sp. PSN332]|nr:hypothetical protein QBC44DRAFT_339050 [Cladorrhinum sp. PSN332]